MFPKVILDLHYFETFSILIAAFSVLEFLLEGWEAPSPALPAGSRTLLLHRAPARLLELAGEQVCHRNAQGGGGGEMERANTVNPS